MKHTYTKRRRPNAWILTATRSDGTVVVLPQPMRYMSRGSVASLIRLGRSTGHKVDVTLGYVD